jgi:hypothetical protein
MDGPVEHEKVLIELYPAKEAILKSMETKLRKACQTLLIFHGIPNSEFSKQKQGHLLETTLRTLDSNLSSLRNRIARFLFMTIASIASGRLPLANIAEFRIVIYQK